PKGTSKTSIWKHYIVPIKTGYELTEYKVKYANEQGVLEKRIYPYTRDAYNRLSYGGSAVAKEYADCILIAYRLRQNPLLDSSKVTVFYDGKFKHNWTAK